MANQVYNMVGDQVKADSFSINWDSMTNANMANAVTVTAGTGAPTFAAPKGSIYTNITGSTTATRLYVNTDGSTTWTNVTTAG